MRFNRGLHYPLLVGAVVLLFLLFWQIEQRGGVDQTEQLRSHLQTAIQLDANLTRDVLRLRSGLLLLDDPLVDRGRALRAELDDVRSLLRANPARLADLLLVVDRFKEHVDERLDLIQRFRLHYNRLRTATAVLQNDLELVELAATWRGPEGVVTAARDAVARASEFVVLRSESRERRARAATAALAGIAGPGADVVTDAVAVLIRHLDLALEETVAVDRIVDILSDPSFDRAAASLIGIVRMQHRDTVFEKQQYGRLLVLLAVILLAGTAYYLHRLLKATAWLVQARAQLETRVEERTAALVDANRALEGEIRERRAAETAMERQALTDGLTGLGNRIHFERELGAAIVRGRQHHLGVEVMLMDLDNFKPINDRFGHPTGDRLIQEVAHRIRQTCRASDTVVRLGGDEFAVLCDRPTDREPPALLCDRLRAALSRPIEFDDKSLRVTASIGIARSPEDGDDVVDLIRKADVALYDAKAQGGDIARYFDHELDRSATERSWIETDLHKALENEEFRLVYQPQMAIATRAVIGFEALIRWRHPIRGEIMPGRFIDVAERGGLGLAIGRWVMAAACRQAYEWRASGLPTLRVWINVAPRQFRDPGFVADVRAALRHADLAADGLGIEITERVGLEDGADVIAKLDELRDLGVELAIDDFGTGYSSLSYLRQFPVQQLKIDRSFIAMAEKTRDGYALARAAVRLGHTLDMRVLAEGVEQLEQLDALQELGCDEAQGYLFGQPMEAEDVPPWLLMYEAEGRRLPGELEPVVAQPRSEGPERQPNDREGPNPAERPGGAPVGDVAVPGLDRLSA